VIGFREAAEDTSKLTKDSIMSLKICFPQSSAHLDSNRIEDSTDCFYRKIFTINMKSSISNCYMNAALI